MRSAFQNVDVNAGLVELGTGGLVRFSNSSFQNVHTLGDVWVTAASDDDWAFVNDETIISMAQPQRDVGRSLIRGPAAEVDSTERCSETYFVEEDMLYDEAYGLLDYDFSSGVCVIWAPLCSIRPCRARLSSV